jgi:transposase
MREYTGDGIVFSLDLKKDAEEKTYIESYSHQLITTHIDEDRNSLVQFLDLDFIKNQNEKNKKYYEKRLELMNKIQGTITWK